MVVEGRVNKSHSTCVHSTCPLYESLYVPTLRAPLRVPLRAHSTSPSTCPLYESLYVPTLRVPLRVPLHVPLRVPLRVPLYVFLYLSFSTSCPSLRNAQELTPVVRRTTITSGPSDTQPQSPHQHPTRNGNAQQKHGSVGDYGLRAEA